MSGEKILGKKMKIIITAFTIFAVFGGFLHADSWYNYYEDGQGDIKNKQWTASIEKLKKAIEEKPVPKLKAKTSGLRFIDYTPYYYLGYAYYSLGKHSEAKRAFDMAVRYQIVTRKSSLYTHMNKMLSDCNVKLKPKPVRKPAVKRPRESRNAQLIKSYLTRGDNLAAGGSYEAALREYKKAKSLIEKSGEETSSLHPLNNKIQNADNIIRKNGLLASANTYYRSKKYSQADKVIDQLFMIDPGNPDATSLRRRIRDEVARASTPKTTSGTTISMPSQVRAEEVSVSRLIKEADSHYKQGELIKAKEKYEAVIVLKPNDTRLEGKLDNINYTISIQSINSGVSYYFEGDLERSKNNLQNALDALANQRKYSKKLMIIHQFLAAVYINEYYLTGGGNLQLMNKAKGHVIEVYRLNPKFIIEKDYFSPKIVQVFNDGSAR
jgi:tetratricopeptide (TPR) repeat protein